MTADIEVLAGQHAMSGYHRLRHLALRRTRRDRILKLRRVVHAIDALAEAGPGLGRPLVDTIHGSSLPNPEELRLGTVRILFAFGPWRSSILLVTGDKSGRRTAWYQEAIPLAEQRYERYLKERTQEEEQR